MWSRTASQKEIHVNEGIVSIRELEGGLLETRTIKNFEMMTKEMKENLGE